MKKPSTQDNTPQLPQPTTQVVNKNEVVSKIDTKKYKSKSSMIQHHYFVSNLSVSEISKKEELLYQHVRNVVKNEEDRRLIESIRSKEEKK